VKQRQDLSSARRQRRLSGTRCHVDPASIPGDLPERGPQVATARKRVQDGVKGAGTEAVAMVLQFVDEPLAEDFSTGRVMENVEANGPTNEVPLHLSGHHPCGYQVFHRPELHRLSIAACNIGVP
jgi:hypothetical protein